MYVHTSVVLDSGNTSVLWGYIPAPTTMISADGRNEKGNNNKGGPRGHPTGTGSSGDSRGHPTGTRFLWTERL